MSTPGIPVVDSSLLRRGTSQQQDGTQPLSFSLIPMHSKEIGQLPHGSETLSGLGAPCRKALPRHCRGRLFQFTCSGTCTSGLHKETPRLHGLANSSKEMLSSVTAANVWAGQAITALIFSLLLSQQLEKTYKLSSCFWFYGL